MLDNASSEIELLRACMKGNTTAFEAIVKKYQSLVCAITFSATANLDKSEELAHEAFIRAWTNLSQLKDLTKFRTWLCSIARNIVLNYFRHEERDIVSHARSIDKMTDISSVSFEPVEAIINKEQQVVIRQALEQIPERYREPLVLFYREQKSLKQVAKLLELSEDAAKTRVSRGRKLLKEQVAAMVESTISRTGPGKAFTTAVVASISGIAIKGVGVTAAAGVAATGTTAVVKTVISGTAAKIIAAAAVVAIGLGALVTYRHIANPERRPDSFVTANTSREEELGEEAANVAAMGQVSAADTVVDEKQLNEAAISKETGPVTVEGQAGESAGDDSNVGESKAGVSGIVIDKQTSRPIKGAEVFYSFSGQRHSVVADVNGYFEFLDMQLNERQYVDVIAKNYTTRRIILNIVKNKVCLDFNIELTQGAGVAGIVTDESGKPIAGARVKTFHFTNHPVTTAEDGEFEIDGLDPAFGQYSLHVTHPNYPAVQVSFPSPAAGQTALMDVVLKPGVTVHGKITDSEENPVADVEIGTTTSLIMWNSVKCKTDTEGMYTLENVPVGELVLWTMSDKHAPYVERFSLDGSEAQKLINIQLDDPWPLRGKIVDTRGNAVPGAKVIIEEYKGVGSFFASEDQSDSGGRFVIPNAPATGKVTVHVYGEDISRISTELEMGQREYVIKVNRNSKFYGKVVDDKTDAPITRFNVKLRSSKKGSNPGWGYTATWSDEGHYFDSEQGFFETTDLQVGAEYSVTVYADGFDPLAIDPVVMPPISQDSSRTEFRLKSSTAITGRIVDSNDVPIAGARIRFLTDDNKFYHYDDRDTTFSNSRGEFNLAEVGTAELCIYITAETFEPYLGSSLTLPRDSEDSIKIVLAPGANVFGTVFGLDGRGVPNAKVSASVASWGLRLYDMLSSPYPVLINTITDVNGYYELLDLPAGPISLRVSSSPSSGLKRINLKPDQLVELNFGDETGFTLTGVVRMGEQPLKGAYVEVSLPDRSTKDGRTDDKGRFLIKGIPKGVYEALVDYSLDDIWLIDTREIVIDANVELDFDMGTGTVSGRVPERFIGTVDIRVERWAPKQSRDGWGLRTDWEVAARDGKIDSEGYFTCSHLRAGRYHLQLITKQGIMGISDIFELSESEHLEDIVFNIGSGMIQISVVDLETAEAIPNARFTIENDLETTLWRMSTDEEGLAECPDLPRGKYVVWVQTPGYITGKSEWLSVDNGTSTAATVYLERSAIVAFELTADVRQQITAEMACVCIRVTDLDTGRPVPKPTPMQGDYREYDEHTVYFVPDNISRRGPPTIDLPQGWYRIKYRLIQGKKANINTNLPPLVEGAVSIELLKGKTTTIIVYED